jgi:hypothetical protein
MWGPEFKHQYNNKPPKEENPRPDSFIGELYQIFKELTPIILKLQLPQKNKKQKKNEEEGALLNHSVKSPLPPYQNQTQILWGEKLQTLMSIPNEYTCKNSQQSISKQNSTIHLKGL